MIMGVAGGICNVRYDHCIWNPWSIMGQHVSAVFYNSVVLRNQTAQATICDMFRVN